MTLTMIGNQHIYKRNTADPSILINWRLSSTCLLTLCWWWFLECAVCLVPAVVIRMVIALFFLYQCTYTSACTGTYVAVTARVFPAAVLSHTSRSHFLRWFDFDNLKFAILKSQRSASSQVTKSFFIFAHFPRHSDKTGQHHHKLNIS